MEYRIADFRAVFQNNCLIHLKQSKEIIVLRCLYRVQSSVVLFSAGSQKSLNIFFLLHWLVCHWAIGLYCMKELKCELNLFAGCPLRNCRRGKTAMNYGASNGEGNNAISRRA